MFAEERKKNIVEAINQDGSVKVGKLADVYGVTEATIRRDLQELEEKKMLQRTHGGAVAMDSTKYELTVLERKDSYYQQKLQIGMKAAEMVEDGDSIIIDAGTTTLQMARHLNRKNITVVTNSMTIAAELEGKPEIELIMIGGMVRWSTHAFVGPLAEEMLEKIRVDKVFLGTNGITLDDGLTTPNMLEAKIKQIMLAVSTEKILLCDSSKFSRRSFSKICKVQEIDMIISDGMEVIRDQNKYKELGIKLSIV
ncbi:transcriptional regulator, DeoR family [Alkaliphilus metalliredigens QYMF]|uniref:Transcriptional regulator, DeoR family n=1 Tax=Alkaliphilus metalliredigens (strain QYMF) TaxID=293826 RepID=A6TLI2_ALKMQ|nr:DeoR/GlpR family DNA-binding transcription regulator [Alkaliphilus metalliredigens]ABR47050.1 transcriptional regulator, DeoR family [Alkaliphilus metalliredigens QYMF]